MSKTYRTYRPEMDYLLPPKIQDWLTEDHLAYFVRDLVAQMDLGEIYRVYEQEDRGQPPYHPRMMTTVLVYAYCMGVYSSRKIAQRMVEDVAFRMLGAGNMPDHRTISDFRKTHLEALKGLFKQGLELALEAGAVKVGRVALDGSKVQGNSSKHKAMSYGKMEEKEKELEGQVEALMKAAEGADREEDERYGKEGAGEGLPVELKRRESRLQKIREAKRVLEERAREKGQKEGKGEEEAQPKSKDQYNFTDPESRILKGPNGFLQGYNVQIVVESEHQLIVGQEVTNASNDKEQLIPMMARVEEQSGRKPEQVLADSGYCSEKNLEAKKEDTETELYIAVGKESQKQEANRQRNRVSGVEQVEKMRAKLKTPEGAKIYAQRKGIVEPVFGQIKQARGFRQFLLRGIEKVKAEWALVCLTHNILKMYRFSSE